MSEKYPRSMHLPYSPGASSDDKIMTDDMLDSLIGKEIVITEKLDGSNVCLTRDNVFSRSHNGPPVHASFSPLKALHASLRMQIDEGFSVFGEWCYAVHSIRYSMLQHHLSIFGIRNDKTNKWLSWEDVEFYSLMLNVPTVPLLLRGAVANKEQLQKIVESLCSLSSVYGPEREGVVVRLFDAPYEKHGKLMGLGKWVRKNHVTTDEHWMRKKIEKQPAINILENF